MAGRNLSFILKEKNSFYFEERNIPEIKNEYDVLLKVINVGICGSDIHFWEDGKIGDIGLDNHVILGHEVSALVIKCGSKVTDLQEGDRVALEPGISCEKCLYCKTGKYHLCESGIFFSCPPHDGAMCQYMVHRGDLCHKLPSNVSNIEGAMVEPLAVGVHACRRAQVTVGSKILIIGAGAIGLLSLLVARSFGAGKIVVADINEKRLALASSLGADYTIHITRGQSIKDIALSIKKKLNSLVDKTLECSGAPDAIALGIEVSAPGGCVTLVGLGKSIVQVPIITALFKEVDIVTVFRYVNCFPTAISLLSDRKVDVKPLISHRFPFADAEKAFEVSKSGEGLKVILEIAGQ